MAVGAGTCILSKFRVVVDCFNFHGMAAPRVFCFPYVRFVYSCSGQMFFDVSFFQIKGSKKVGQDQMGGGGSRSYSGEIVCKVLQTSWSLS